MIDTVGETKTYEIRKVADSVALIRLGSLRPSNEEMLTRDEAVKLATLLLVAAVNTEKTGD